MVIKSDKDINLNEILVHQEPGIISQKPVQEVVKIIEGIVEETMVNN